MNFPAFCARRGRRALSLALAFAICACVALFSAPGLDAQSSRSQARWSTVGARLDSIFRDVDSATTPGCVAGVSRDGGNIVLRSYGLADLEQSVRNDSSTVFEAGSVSKQFTAAAIVLLAQQGKLSLDDSVRRWIPELSRDASSFTIRQMLHHESGLRDYGSIVQLTGWPRGTRAYDINAILPTLAKQRALNFSPGAEYSYSNTNYVLAGVIVARASGESLASFTKRALFTPLGMTHTGWRDDYTRVVAHRAPAWSPDDSAQWHLDMPFESVVGHAGLLTTVPDLLKWQENFRHPTVGGDAFVREMQTDGVLTDGTTSGYALGLRLETVDELAAVTHAGATAGYRAYVGRTPSTGVAVALLCNAGQVNTQDLGPALLIAANDPPAVAATKAAPLGAAATGKSATSRNGLYRSRRTRDTSKIEMFANGLTIDGYTAYRARGDGYVSASGARVLTFEGDRDGAPLRYRVQTSGSAPLYYDRIAEWKPATSALREFVGHYTSEEATASWTLRMRGDSLVIDVRPGLSAAMVPLYRDAFQVPSQGWLITIRRDRAGSIVALDVGETRMRTMPFTKSPGTRAAQGR